MLYALDVPIYCTRVYVCDSFDEQPYPEMEKDEAAPLACVRQHQQSLYFLPFLILQRPKFTHLSTNTTTNTQSSINNRFVIFHTDCRTSDFHTHFTRFTFICINF